MQTEFVGGFSAVDSLTAELSKYVVSFCHPFYVYNYRKLADFPVDPHATEISGSKYVRNMYADWAKHYLTAQEPREAGENAEGLYFAVDPIVSRNFGRKEWILHRAEIPATMIALNVAYLMYESDEKRLIPAATQEKLRAQGCDETKYDNLFRKVRSKACHQIALDVLRALDVDAVQYSWRAADFASCAGRQRFAYIVLRPEIIRSTVVFSYQQIEKTHLEESRALLALFKTAQKNRSPFVLDWSTADDDTVPRMLASPEMRVWPDQDLEPLSDVETAQWIRAHLLGCQN